MYLEIIGRHTRKKESAPLLWGENDSKSTLPDVSTKKKVLRELLQFLSLVYMGPPI